MAVSPMGPSFRDCIPMGSGPKTETGKETKVFQPLYTRLVSIHPTLHPGSQETLGHVSQAKTLKAVAWEKAVWLSREGGVAWEKSQGPQRETWRVALGPQTGCRGFPTSVRVANLQLYTFDEVSSHQILSLECSYSERQGFLSGCMSIFYSIV